MSQEFEHPACASQPLVLYDKRLLEMFESIAVCKVMNVKEWDETMPYEDEDETPTNLTLIGCSNVTTSNSVDNPPGLIVIFQREEVLHPAEYWTCPCLFGTRTIFHEVRVM